MVALVIQQAGSPDTAGYSKLMRQTQLRKALAYSLFLLSVSDYMRLCLYTSLYFIVINLHTELKPQVG